MDHVAIMKESWGMADKILSGRKRIESRWYMSRSAPWDDVKSGDAIYFKDAGGPVRIRAEVEKVLQFSDLTPRKVKTLLKEYSSLNGIEDCDASKFFHILRKKKYCILIFLKGAKEIRPFEVRKIGFGSMSAWMTVKNIDNIKK
jgi:ASC-1-like (ASCH) protein